MLFKIQCLPDGTPPDADYGQRVTQFVGTLAKRFVDTLQRLRQTEKVHTVSLTIAKPFVPKYSQRTQTRAHRKVIYNSLHNVCYIITLIHGLLYDILGPGDIIRVLFRE